MSTATSEQHAYDLAKAAGRVPYKVADLNLGISAGRNCVWPRAKCPA